MNATTTTEQLAPETIGRATYSPEDNKLRIYPHARLPADIYARVKEAGYIWAAKQELFVAPMWTPGRADLAVELCGEIEDEDTSLCERAEERADRFEEYSEKRADDATRARDYVASIADGIPLGQPILVGHHSERAARRDAKRIENGMRRAVSMWETSEYWTRRAAGAVRAAKYKELSTVRARRIKGLEADKRKQERERAEAEKWLALWTECGTLEGEVQQELAVRIAGACWLHMPRKEGDRPDFNQNPTAYNVLTNQYPNLYASRTAAEVVAHAAKVYPRQIAHCNRWVAHITNRLAYERAMLDEQGATALLAPKPRTSTRAALPLCNYQVPDGLDIPNQYHRGQMDRYPMAVMTKAEYAAIHADYKGTRIVGGSHRVRTAMVRLSGEPGDGGRGLRHCVVFLSDSKTHEPPAAVDPTPPAQPAAPAPRLHVVPVEPAIVSSGKEIVAFLEQRDGPTVPEIDKAAEFKAMRESLRTGAGVQVVTANQLFPTPRELAERMADMLDVKPGHTILEPSAGTGMLLGALGGAMFAGGSGLPPYRERHQVQAVEINRALADRLEREFPLTDVLCADFLEVKPAYEGGAGLIVKQLGQPFYDRIIMNPPFENGADIKHIKHALKFLKTGGLLVGICAGGPRQREALEPLASYWEELPAGTFAHTGVRTVLFTIGD